MADTALKRLRRLLHDYPQMCTAGHGGHQLDAKFCRICGRQLAQEDHRASRKA